MTKKQQLIQRLNELRTKNNLPAYDPKKVTMTVEEIEGLIYHLETPSHSHKPPQVAELTAGDLLKKLNVLRQRAKEKPLKKWSADRASLLRAIKDMERELVEEAMLKHKRGATKIADGADTRRTHTDLHNNPIREDMVKMRKREERQRIATARDTAKKIALWAGYTASNVLAYLLAKNVSTPALAGDALKADIKAWLALRDKVLPQKRGKPRSPLRVFRETEAERLGVPERGLHLWLEANEHGHDKPLSKPQEKALRAFLKARPKLAAPQQRKRQGSDSVTPQDIATASGLDAKAVRVRLRKLESKIPKGWRVAEERWGFKPAHKGDIVKLVKG